MSRKAYVYILKCGDESLYTGWTYDVNLRVREHQAGRGGRYTRSHLPVELVFVRQMADKYAAMREESYIKRMDRSTKLNMVEQFKNGLERYLSGRDQGYDQEDRT